MTMSSLKSCLLAISSVAVLGIASHSHAQHFYKWVDKNGSTHYTLTPPPKNAKKQGRIFTINDTPSGSQYRPPAPETNTPTQNSTTPTTTPQPNGTPVAEPVAEPVANLPPLVIPNTSSTANKGERLALPPRIPDPTAGQYAPLR